MTYICLTSENLSDFTTLDAKICQNLNIPNNMGTISFLFVSQAFNQDFYFTALPLGWVGNKNENFTQDQVLSGTNLSPFIQQPFDPSWIPAVE
jgi:hypothetical protein